MKSSSLFFLFSFVPVAACSTVATVTPPQPEDAATSPDGFGGPPDVETDAESKMTGLDGGASDARADARVRVVDSGIELNDAGCVSWNTAANYCARTGPLCAFSAACGNSQSADQCSINCTMRTAIECFSSNDMKCLLDATEADSCTALSACKWKL